MTKTDLPYNSAGDLRPARTVILAHAYFVRAAARAGRSQTSMVTYILGFYRAGSTLRAILIRTPRRACTVEIIFYFCRAAAAWICTLIYPPHKACATADLTGRHRANPT
jgi:hypothetical protein